MPFPIKVLELLFAWCWFGYTSLNFPQSVQNSGERCIEHIREQRIIFKFFFVRTRGSKTMLEKTYMFCALKPYYIMWCNVVDIKGRNGVPLLINNWMLTTKDIYVRYI